MKKIIIILMMCIISSCSYYGKVNESGEIVTDFENTIQESKIEKDKISNSIEENKKEENIMQIAITEKSKQQKQEQINQVENKKENSNNDQAKSENVKVNNIKIETSLNQSNTQNKEQQNKTEKQEIQKQNNITIPKVQKKYVKNDKMIEKIRNVIENNITEDMKKYGYKIVIDSSMKELTNQFTFTENRVKNNIKYSFDIIKIYAEDYYSNGQLIMTQCYIL